MVKSLNGIAGIEELISERTLRRKTQQRYTDTVKWRALRRRQLAEL